MDENRTVSKHSDRRETSVLSDTARSRDSAIDIVRGLCVLEMVQTHLSAGSPLWRYSHFQPWVDGASGFCLMSGLVLGMVYRRTATQGSRTTLAAKRAKRVLLLLGSHLSIVSLAVWVWLATDSGPATALQDVSAARLTWWVATLQVNPGNIDMLSMYAVLIALPALWTPLLAAGRGRYVLALSVIVYVTGVVLDWGALPNRPTGHSFFSIACWQLLFTGAFVVGWKWDVAKQIVRGRYALLCAFIVGPSAVAVAILLPDNRIHNILFDKSNCGPGRIALAWCTFIVLYQAARFVTSRAPHALVFVEKIGSRSLACFIALCILVIAEPLIIGNRTDGWGAEIAALLAAISMYAVARGRDLAGTSATYMKDEVRRRWRSRASPPAEPSLASSRSAE